MHEFMRIQMPITSGRGLRPDIGAQVCYNAGDVRGQDLYAPLIHISHPVLTQGMVDCATNPAPAGVARCTRGHCTALQALALCRSVVSDNETKSNILASMERHAEFVTHGRKTPPPGRGAVCPPYPNGWAFNSSGGLGMVTVEKST